MHRKMSNTAPHKHDEKTLNMLAKNMNNKRNELPVKKMSGGRRERTTGEPTDGCWNTKCYAQNTQIENHN